jgi:hypothetical protein
MKRWIAILAVCFAVVMVGGGAAPPCWGIDLIKFTDNNTTGTGLVGLVQTDFVWYASWNQTVPSTGITISAILHAHANASGEGTAYLTNAIGSVFTPQNLIASAPYTAPVLTLEQMQNSNTAPYTTLFSGLALEPGTYYLILTGPPVGQYSWCYDDNPLNPSATNPPTITTASGYTVLNPGQGFNYVDPWTNPFFPNTSYTLYFSVKDATTYNLYNYTFYYGNGSGDKYTGSVYAASNYGYHVGDTIANTDTAENGTPGYYVITGVTTGDYFNLLGQVTVHQYYDSQKGQFFTPTFCWGINYLNSEYGFINITDYPNKVNPSDPSTMPPGIQKFFFGHGSDGVFYEADFKS